jgi:hypothetical protein
MKQSSLLQRYILPARATRTYPPTLTVGILAIARLRASRQASKLARKRHSFPDLWTAARRPNHRDSALFSHLSVLLDNTSPEHPRSLICCVLAQEARFGITFRARLSQLCRPVCLEGGGRVQNGLGGPLVPGRPPICAAPGIDIVLRPVGAALPATAGHCRKGRPGGLRIDPLSAPPCAAALSLIAASCPA